MRPKATNARTKSQSDATATTATSEQASQPRPGKGKGKAAKQVDVQKIKTQNANFRAQPKPQQVPAVTFNASRQISGSEHWQGTQYTVFRSYRPQWHDQNWYRSRYNRIELIAGGFYFFDAGYWYPAWGYQPTAQYYVYDGPIYAGSRAEPPDRVIADVQAALQEMGYYRGEVDGLLGPLTREALIGYQSDNGLYITAAIDEPTLESLGSLSETPITNEKPPSTDSAAFRNPESRANAGAEPRPLPPPPPDNLRAISEGRAPLPASRDLTSL